jgi:hypothetical protein
MMLADQWYYRIDGKSHGPFTVAQFEKLIRGKAVVAETEVSNDGKTWQTLLQTLDSVPSQPQPDSAEWMNAPTLLPGQVRIIPPPPKEEKKPGES